MSKENSNGPQSQKKILENPFVGSLVVPIAIVLVGALVIFGITKMLSSERSYRDLVEEIQSKTFGNKWVAAYELSKQINSAQIPQAEYPWMIANLTEAYNNSVDARTRSFIIAALGALKSELTLPTLAKALSDQDTDVKFHCLVALGNMPKGIHFEWSQVINFLSVDEVVLKQAAVLTLATHQVAEAQEPIAALLNDKNTIIKYSAAMSLIGYKYAAAIPLLKEILLSSYPTGSAPVVNQSLDAQQIVNLKLGVMNTLVRVGWNELNETLLEVANKDTNNSVATKAREVLNLLKK
jgi:hypothetical protein